MSIENWLTELERPEFCAKPRDAEVADLQCFKGLLFGLPLSAVLWIAVYVVADYWL
ncbi:MAG: hypothetical protein KA533_08545 [Sphingobium sp.]|nr:hypothetical protein [Sphingobium sp.]MBP6111619.1 hypothetical protein [Sphingobium sp.]MBP8671194.1 hypothetical protein [Sphingobium sp.]MBP9158221.1 hypothetical protein [Sphingobium sp.]MCC6481872.1 hypothetical protein [Sphingomonadaceae bacterium]